MRRLVPFLLLAALACGEADPPAPTPDPAPAPAPEQAVGSGGFTLDVRPAAPGQRAPVRVGGDAREVTVEVARLEEPELPLGWDGAGEIVGSQPAVAGRWSYLPALPAGIYRVTARREEEREERWLFISDLTIVLRRVAREALVWVVDSADGRPVASARVLRRHGGENREGVTDRSGVFRFEVESGEPLEILVTRGGRAAYVVDDGFETKDVLAFLLLDREEVRPGGEFRVAGVYRKRDGDLRLVEAPRVRLLIRDERGSIVAAADPEEHVPGFFHGRLRLPVEPPKGPLDLVADLGFGEESIRIPMPRPPEVGFTATLFDIDFAGLSRQGRHSFHVGATDVAGRPLAGATVRYRVDRRDRGRFVPVLEGRGRLPGDGPYQFSLEPQAGLLRVVAEVVDRNGLVQRREAEIGHPEAVGEDADPDLRLTVEPNVVAPGGEVRVHIPVAADLQDRPILLTMASRGLGPHTVEKLAGYRHTTTFRLPDQPGATVRFEATLVDGGRVRRGTAEVVLPGASRELNLEVAAEGEALVVTVDADVPESARGLVVMHPWTWNAVGPGIEEVFYDGTRDRFIRIDAVEDPSPGAPEPPEDGLRRHGSADPVLWRTDVRFTDGRAVLPLDGPIPGGRYLVEVAVATADHRFGSTLRALDFAGDPAPPAEPLVAPAPRPPSRARPGTLPAGISGCSLDLPIDATDARLEILVTRGPLAAAARAARSEMGRSLQTTDGAIASFLPALLVWRTARERSEALGIRREEVESMAAALARIYARQESDGGFAPWDGALADTVTTARVLEALVDARHWVEVDEDRIRRAVDRLAEVDSSDDATAALVFSALSRAGHRHRARIEKRFPADATNRLPPRAVARLIQVWFDLDQSRVLPSLRALKRKARTGPGETLSWSDTPDRDVETTAIVAADLVEDVERAVRFLLDRRTGASWADPRTATAAVRALMTHVATTTPEEGDPVPVRIRVESGLVAAVRLPMEELTTTGRTFVVEDGSVPRGAFEVEFTRGGGTDVDVVATLSWQPGDRGPRPDDILGLTSGLVRITADGRAPLKGPASRGDTLLLTVEVEAKEDVGPFAVDIPLPAGAIALPAHVFDIGTPPGVGRTDRDGRVRYLVPRMGPGKLRLEVVLRTLEIGTFPRGSVTAHGLDSGADLGASEAGTLEIR